MRLLFIIHIILGLVIQASAQDNNLTKKEVRQMERIKKKEAAEKQALVDKQITSEIIKNQRYLLLVDQISNQYGDRLNVNSTINFILVDSSRAVLQTGNDWNMYGANGVGGVTVEGRVSSYELKKSDKKENYTITFNISSAIGSYSVNLRVGSSGYSTARVSSITRGGYINFHGRLLPPSNKKIFKGSSF
jgi:hypothetical protein